MKKVHKLKLLSEKRPQNAHKDFSKLAEIIQTDCKDASKSIQLLSNILSTCSYPKRSQLYSHNSAVLINLQSALKIITGQLKILIESNRDLLVDNIAPTPKPIPLVSMVDLQASHQPQAPYPPSGIPSHALPGTSSQYQANHSLIPLINSNLASNMPPLSHQSLLLTDAHYASSQSNTVPSSIMLQSHQQQMFAPQMVNSSLIDQEIRLRDSAVNKVEQTILQLGEMYQQFSSLVHEQSDMVTRIDTQLDDAYEHVDAAHIQLITFLKTVSRRRQFILKAFLSIIICFAIFALLYR
ncbi:Syntaxin-5 [Cichlidogyrus casuarinus]|uniref:Syntaxin-5 n=1 Tax=Cichlidogyrus casuarinus TaxID=1844966 RepID=A0ABD2QKR4_9PLAT